MSAEIANGPLRKMQVSLDTPVKYQLPLGEHLVHLNPMLGQMLQLSFSGDIRCVHCGRNTKKSFNQGYCFPCFKSLAECDMCIMRPETCHFSQGTCRDPEWAQQHCMQDHYVYVANSSGLKVGITRGTQVPTRWIDQGALQAIPVFRVKNRLHSGLLETAIKKHVSDRTDWRKMLKGGERLEDFADVAKQIIEAAESDIKTVTKQAPDFSAESLSETAVEIHYPVDNYPEKVSSLNFDKTAVVEGVLQGIKGQYLIFDVGVINIRKFAGYHVSLSA